MTGIGEEVSASVAQHVRVYVSQPGPISRTLDRFCDVAPGHWSGTLACEYEGRLWFLVTL